MRFRVVTHTPVWRLRGRVHASAYSGSARYVRRRPCVCKHMNAFVFALRVFVCMLVYTWMYVHACWWMLMILKDVEEHCPSLHNGALGPALQRALLSAPRSRRPHCEGATVRVLRISAVIKTATVVAAATGAAATAAD
eukprot:GHVU01203046.1.p1 GENE.GHVU01203046.1~~GHVU01203046.1.p1  ORF type:complete len:138 (-),score=0.96 GHVU01203046.1:193-606(-)